MQRSNPLNQTTILKQTLCTYKFLFTKTQQHKVFIRPNKSFKKLISKIEYSKEVDKKDKLYKEAFS